MIHLNNPFAVKFYEDVWFYIFYDGGRKLMNLTKKI